MSKSITSLSKYELGAVVSITIAVISLIFGYVFNSFIFALVAITLSLIQRKTKWTRVTKTCYWLGLICLIICIIIFLLFAAYLFIVSQFISQSI